MKHSSSKKSPTSYEPPFPSLNHFIKSYEPFSKFLNILCLQNSKDLSFVFDDEGFYYGEMKDKVKNGLGVYFHQSSAIFEGNWSHNLKQGLGYERYYDGSSYEGNFHNGLREGNGKEYLINGETYDGEWSKGKRNGPGIFTSKNGINYVGEWKKGKMDGYGVINEQNGDKYEGLIKDGMRNGKGVLILQNGNIYKGYFESNEYNGFGEFYEKNGNSYCGEFRKGKKEGPGELKIIIPKIKTYRGFFRDDFKEGYGVFTWDSGSCYKGFFERDKRNGYGEIFWADGNIYRGWWKDGFEHGKGELFVKDKGLMNGIFNNNILTVLILFKDLTREEYLDSFKEEKNPKYERVFANKSKIEPLKLNKSPQKTFNETKVFARNSEDERKTLMKVCKKRSKTLNYSVDYNLTPTNRINNFSQNENVLKESESLELPLVFNNRLKNNEKNSSSIKKNFIKLQAESRYDNRCISSMNSHSETNKKLHSVLGIHENFLSRVITQESSILLTHRKADSTIWNTKTKKDGSMYRSFRNKILEESRSSICDKN